MATVPISTSRNLNTLQNRQLRSCAHCGSFEIYRQRPRGIIERHVYGAFRYAPYWCADCDSRFYLRVSKDTYMRHATSSNWTGE
jgi:DNA-directed RNA polymerase subunit RPC12/RpoP